MKFAKNNLDRTEQEWTKFIFSDESNMCINLNSVMNRVRRFRVGFSVGKLGTGYFREKRETGIPFPVGSGNREIGNFWEKNFRFPFFVLMSFCWNFAVKVNKESCMCTFNDCGALLKCFTIGFSTNLKK